MEGGVGNEGEGNGGEGKKEVAGGSGGGKSSTPASICRVLARKDFC